jgi:transposase
MRLARTQPTWALGFADEVWWSRLAQPEQHRWSEAGGITRLQDLERPKADPDPKALACYGVWVRDSPLPADQMLLRFVEGRPVSAVTMDFLAWCSERLAAQGVTALFLIWDNASWHKSQAVRTWLRQHNQRVKATGHGVRIVAFRLPVKSPWLNPIEPQWVHGKRAVAEADRMLSARELAIRICTYYGCDLEEHLIMPQKVA